MTKTLKKPEISGKIKAIASKSEAHRLLICAALGNRKTEIVCENLNADIKATAECLSSLGAEIEYNDGIFSVSPIKNTPENPLLPCNESGSTLRFLLPVTAMLGKGGVFKTEGRLSERPLSPLKEELERAGVSIKKLNKEIIVSGNCCESEFSIAGDVSSQFISGLMFMLTFTGGKITVTGNIESRPYIDMTADALRLFGCNIDFTENIITVPKTCPLISPEKTKSFGDWSNAAFFITAGVIGKKPVTVTGLDMNSRQGDKKIIDVLRFFGAEIRITEDEITAYPSLLYASDIDARDIPDLVPVLSVAAANARGTTRIYNCSRLRLKESDRIEAVRMMISSLGGKISIIDDDIIIEGATLNGGTVSSENDHRIAMSTAVAAFSTENEVTVIDAEAVNKSYPSFWDEIK
ncbi:MAG: 3-phosphoshikimate 1-carboxyvinyltransferase [Clostridia bacterium]|nr:3-phosphoshikimate 1-carboxyvinyltransferase [Clostridia bacterium]